MLRDALAELRRRLPPGWHLSEPRIEPTGRSTERSSDALVQLTAPDGRKGSIALEAKTRLDPKGVSLLGDLKRGARGVLVVITRYLSEGTRTRLHEEGISYLDLTGNVRIILSAPGLFIETQGASKDPAREERPARSLRGAKAGRIVRALIDHKEPPGVRELAERTGIDAGYISRVLTFLDSQALITRVGRGRLQSVDWPALLRRWAKDSPLESRGQVQTYLEPRGLSALRAHLAKFGEKYAVTGGLAAAALAPMAPARLGVLWVPDAADAAMRLGVRPTEAGANVLLIEPRDDSVFEGAVKRDGIWYAAPSQIAADLLTSPGRGPTEAEELISWMRANEDAWRR